MKTGLVVLKVYFSPGGVFCSARKGFAIPCGTDEFGIISPGGKEHNQLVASGVYFTDSIADENCFRYFVDFWRYIGAHYHVSFAPNTGPVSQMIYSIGIEYKLNEVYLNRGLKP